MLKNVRILHKMMLSFGTITILSIIIIIISTININKISNNTQKLYNVPYKSNDNIWIVRRNMVSLQRGLYKGIATESDEESKSIVETNNQVSIDAANALNTLKQIFTQENKPEKLDLVNKAIASLEKSDPIKTKINDYIISNDNTKALELIKKEYEPTFEELSSNIFKLSDLISADAENFAYQTKSISNIALITNIIMLIISIILSITIATIITKEVTGPIYEILKATNQVSKGDLNVDIKYNYKNALGDLANATLNTTKELKQYITTETDILGELANKNFDVSIKKDFIGDFKPIKTSIETIINSFNEMMHTIRQASIQVTQSSTQISDSAESLAAGSTQQTAAVEELVATIDEITEHVNKNAQNAQNVNTISFNSVNEIKKGNEYMQNLLIAMDKINHQSQEISNIIKIIDNISSQTNLLSVNASIEAARAGEHGAGFAIVANEIGKLANECGEAAKNTSELINGSIKAVEEGSKLADETAETLKSIVNSASQTSDLVNEISEACSKQADSLKGVLAGVQQVSAVVESNSVATDETSSSSKELLIQAENLTNLLKQYNLRQI